MRDAGGTRSGEAHIYEVLSAAQVLLYDLQAARHQLSEDNALIVSLSNSHLRRVLTRAIEYIEMRERGI